MLTEARSLVQTPWRGGLLAWLPRDRLKPVTDKKHSLPGEGG